LIFKTFYQNKVNRFFQARCAISEIDPAKVLELIRRFIEKAKEVGASESQVES
jgi:hypothetical protein